MARKARAADAPSKPKPKRVRRQCSTPGCLNRVVQGGVCVTHGAKRKLCSHPGCSKAVKLAGFCSAHGPARRKCDAEGCTRVAVQGGRCLSHGARRRVCCYPLSTGAGGEGGRCDKNAIVGGMCKKHYDRVQDASGMLEMSLCMPAAAGAVGGSGSAGEESLGSAPSWGSGRATPSASSAAPASSMGASPSFESTHAQQVPAAVASSARPASVAVPPRHPSSHRGRSLKHKKLQAGHHQRGLSIFDDMDTMDAILNSNSHPTPGASKSMPPQPPQAVVAPAPVASSNHNMSTKTPSTQVSFADCTSLPRSSARSASGGNSKRTPKDSSGKVSPPCTGNASCTCNACRSPTLAIFEQMIQASQKLEAGEDAEAEARIYAGLSPPKLTSPRKASASGGSGKAGPVPHAPQVGQGGKKSGGDVTMDDAATRTPKNVSFLPEEPGSSGSVVRKVSSNSMMDAEAAASGPGWTPQDYRDPPDSHSHRHVPESYPGGYGQYYYTGVEGRQDGPASHALAAVAVAVAEGGAIGGLGRTVSRDVSDDGGGRRPHHHYPRPPPTTYGYQGRRQSPPHPQYYPQPNRHHHRGGYPYPPSFRATPHDFRPPQTPALYDAAPSPPFAATSHDSSAAVVSSHSRGGQGVSPTGGEQVHHDTCLLPKPRGNRAFEHLFIPKEV
ncbi:hypothetical protein ACHAWF_004799 [Thalassiosira exigua]